MARTVGDAKLLFDTLRGPAATDRRSYAAEAARKSLPQKLRVLYVPTLNAGPVDPQIAASCRRAADRLRALGHEVRDGELPLDIATLNAQWPSIGQIGLASMFAAHPEWLDGAVEKYRAMAGQGARLGAPALWALIETVERLRRDCTTKLFAEFDIVMTPACAALPWAAHETHPPTIDGREVGPRGHAIFTGWVNAAGLPAIALPADPSREGLPIGVQLVADYGCDDALFEIGEAYERAAPWGSRWPPELERR